MKVKDFTDFIQANQILDSLYDVSKKYEKMTQNQQIVFLMEAEKVFKAFDKVPDMLWEDEYQKPIPDPEPDQKDVEGIGHAINVWFKGHLCRMFGFDNGYSKEYDDEMRKYEVRKTSPEEMGRSEGIFESLFGQLGESDES